MANWEPQFSDLSFVDLLETPTVDTNNLAFKNESLPYDFLGSGGDPFLSASPPQYNSEVAPFVLSQDPNSVNFYGKPSQTEDNVPLPLVPQQAICNDFSCAAPVFAQPIPSSSCMDANNFLQDISEDVTPAQSCTNSNSPTPSHSCSPRQSFSPDSSNASATKKRLRESARAESQPLTPEVSSTHSQGSTSDEDEAVKKAQKLKKNRQSAYNSRLRKKQYVTELEKKVEDLTKKNAELNARVITLQSENSTMRDELLYLRAVMHQSRERAQQVLFGLGKELPNVLPGSKGVVCLVVLLLAFSFYIYNPILAAFGSANLAGVSLLKNQLHSSSGILKVSENPDVNSLPLLNQDPHFTDKGGHTTNRLLNSAHESLPYSSSGSKPPYLLTQGKELVKRDSSNMRLSSADKSVVLSSDPEHNSTDLQKLNETNFVLGKFDPSPDSRSSYFSCPNCFFNVQSEDSVKKENQPKEYSHPRHHLTDLSSLPFLKLVIPSQMFLQNTDLRDTTLTQDLSGKLAGKYCEVAAHVSEIRVLEDSMKTALCNVTI
eukprot:GCRY01002584.1.p1 GENE.GCRY01002584.1~~GCRY01002584.1.p1  ORF type:complete len:545 (-),score=65.29 GCRY01002584.1:327-1961(-)